MREQFGSGSESGVAASEGACAVAPPTAASGPAFDLSGRVEAPVVPPQIRGRANLPASDSPLAPRHLAPPREGFPLLARALPAGARHQDPSAWGPATRALLHAHLAEAGAVLVRGLPLTSASDFSALVCAMDLPPTRYESSMATRVEVAPRVLTPNAAPPDRSIMLHNEMAFERPVPRQIFFFCESAPGPNEGGETPIARNRDLHAEIGDELIATLERRGLRRRIHYPCRTTGKSRPDRTWQAFFATERREVVEQRCRLRRLAFSWDSDGGLTTEIDQPVTIQQQGRPLWFCTPQVARPVTGIEVTHRDGSPLNPAVLERLRAVQWRAAVAFSWQAGDLLCLDNLSCQHGRLSYAPQADRRLYVSVAGSALASREAPASGESAA